MGLRKLSLVTVVLAVAAAACSEDPAAPTNALCSGTLPAGVVRISNLAFQPAELRVSPGTQVTWVNCDGLAHTSTSDTNEWGSPLLATNATFTRTFPSVGSFPYHCEPHPTMLATIVVE